VIKNTRNQLYKLAKSTTDSLNNYFQELSDGLQQISE